MDGNNKPETVGVEQLRDMLLRLAETHPHEIEEQDRAISKDLIKSYFTETDNLPVHKLV
jgi:hypothetical protein